MKSLLPAPALYIEISQSSLKALDGEDGLELSLEREENGRLTPLCLERLTSSLRIFLKKHTWRPRLRAFCALGSRGVSLRRLSVPSGSREELQRLLPLQIEREFPLPPNELAWGCYQLGSARPSNGALAVQELLVAAVKKEIIQEYAGLLSACGLTPVFTLAALARGSLCLDPPNAYSILDVGPRHSELVSFESGVPGAIRVLPWGTEHLRAALEKAGITQAEAEKFEVQSNEVQLIQTEASSQFEAVLGAEAQTMVRSLQPDWLGKRLYVSGDRSGLKELTPHIAKALGGRVECARLGTPPGEGRSAAIFGLKRSCENNGAFPLLTIEPTAGETRVGPSPARWRWAACAALLLLCLLSLRYAEAFIQKPRLAKRIAEISAYRERLPKIDRDLSFLQYFKSNQPPYLDVLFSLANASPGGTRLETLSMSSRGDLSLRATMRDSQQVMDLRSKLLDSGLFSTVVVEEQTPSPDRQKLTVRLTGQWKAAGERRPSPTASGRTNAPTTNSAAPPARMTNEQLTTAREAPMTNSTPSKSGP